ncbi:hypothetical protein PT7_P020 (plasmid) [Pusillimonas sp. T7-7]|uniref:hypothetical protein n=1 Tax=Pusillimonas sp. (strain T7-7) TaxID=1007105 RepID=UPI0002084A8B|nr:hypothetical protein [Pusillimonas sp. T7-7]AEC22256.1 hypothetical protein PT7_P020 [Pusillimonas sp. T7-7]
MTTKANDWLREAAKEVDERFTALRDAIPERRNAGQIIDTKYGLAFVEPIPQPCRHEFDQDTEACTLCGMSIWAHAARECP